MATEQWLLRDTGDRLSDIADHLDAIRDWAEEEGYTAIQHKLEETWGTLNSAVAAAYQYADGALERR